MHLNGEYMRFHPDERPLEDACLFALLVLGLFDLVEMFLLYSRWRDKCLQYYCWCETGISKNRNLIRTPGLAYHNKIPGKRCGTEFRTETEVIVTEFEFDWTISPLFSSLEACSKVI